MLCYVSHSNLKIVKFRDTERTGQNSVDQSKPSWTGLTSIQDANMLPPAPLFYWEGKCLIKEARWEECVI